MKLNKAAATVFAGTFIGVAGYSATVPAQVQAKASYRVQITKNASVYTSKGKKTKTVYKKNKVLTAYKIRKIKGKYYYDLGKGKYVRTSYAKKYYYRTTTQSKKLVRTIKLYQPTGKKTVKQNAYVKRTVKINLKTGKKTYGKWGSASWKAYKAPSVSGYTASPKQVAKEKVYSWSKNKTVKVKYKKSTSKKSQGKSNVSTGLSPNSANKEKRTNSEQKHVELLNPWNEKKQVMTKQGLLQAINEFRNQVGMHPLTLTNDYDSLLDKRATEKARLCATKGYVNHDGFDEVDKAVLANTNGQLRAEETVCPCYFNEFDTDDKQVNDAVNKFKKDISAEKDDYDAIYINHSRTNIINYAGTVGHYGSMIDFKGIAPDDEVAKTDNIQVAIGLGTYGNGLVCAVIEYIYNPEI